MYDDSTVQTDFIGTNCCRAGYRILAGKRRPKGVIAGVRLKEHNFAGSIALWYEIIDDLPQFHELSAVRKHDIA
jgi:hypothetical protein